MHPENEQLLLPPPQMPTDPVMAAEGMPAEAALMSAPEVWPAPEGQTPVNLNAWAAPDPDGRAPFAKDMLDTEPVEYTSRLARLLHRIGTKFLHGAEAIDSEFELAGRFIGSIGHSALKEQVSTSYTDADGTERTPNFVSRAWNYMSTLQSDRGVQPDEAAPANATEYKGFKETLRSGMTRVADIGRSAVSGVIENAKELHAENLAAKSALKNIEADLHRKGFDAKGEATDKDLTDKIARREHEAEILQKRADFVNSQLKRNSEITNPVAQTETAPATQATDNVRPITPELAEVEDMQFAA